MSESIKAQRARVKREAADMRKKLAALDAIHKQLDGQSWGVGTLDDIADILRDAGYSIDPPEDF